MKIAVSAVIIALAVPLFIGCALLVIILDVMDWRDRESTKEPIK